MATVKDWVTQKFNEWEKAQGGKQSYYAFARYLEVSQASLGQWIYGSAVPTGDEVLSLANKLGPEIYEALGVPRPSAEAQRMTVSFNSLPPDIRQNLTSAMAEADAVLRQQRLGIDGVEARKIVIQILAKWGFRYEK